jgi:hypothetical protein
MKKTFLIVVIGLLLTSCSQDLFNFTLISTKNIEIDKLSTLKKSAEKTKGYDKASLIIIVPTKRVKIDQAITNTIDLIPGCIALVDGVVTTKFWYIPYIYGEQKIVVEATPLIDISLIKTSNLPKFGKIYLNKKGEIKTIQSISAVEFSKLKNDITKNK